MAKQYVTQEVYDAAKNVLNKKSAYEWGEANGDPNFKAYAQEANPYYEVLKSNDIDTYNMLKYNNFSQANDIFKDYAVARDAKTITNDIIAKKFGYENTKAMNPSADLSEYDATDLYSELNAVDPGAATLLKNMNYNQAVAWQNGGTMPTLSQTSTNIAEHAPVKPMTGAEAGARGFNLIGNSGNTILSNIDKMYFDSDYGKDVIDMFNMYGNTEGAQELAKGAAANGGNYDSFANFNRHNTNLAYMLAGQNAVQNMRRGYAEDATKFLDTWGNQLTGSASNIADYEYKDKALASDERIAQMSADTQKAVAQIEADAASKGYSAETINTIISGVTDLILNGKSYAALQGFLDQYGIKLPEQPVTTTDTVVPSGLGGLTKGGLAGSTGGSNPAGVVNSPKEVVNNPGETVTIKTNDTSKGTDTTKPVDTKTGDTKPVDTKDDDTSVSITDDKYNKILVAGKGHQNDSTPEFLAWLIDNGFSTDAAKLIGDHTEDVTVIGNLVKNGYKDEAYMFAAAKGYDPVKAKEAIG